MTRLYTDEVELYDIAFTWDLEDEVSWLLERFGPSCMTVLEPGSGTGRMLEALALRGLAPCGIDSSPAMVAFSRARLSDAGVHAGVMLADMTNFELDARFDAAVCPINTLSHLTEEELASHLARVADHVEPGARYLVQVGVFDDDQRPPPNEWEAERDGTALRIEWALVDRDLDARRERHRSRVEVLAGPREGERVRRGARDDRVDLVRLAGGDRGVTVHPGSPPTTAETAVAPRSSSSTAAA